MIAALNPVLAALVEAPGRDPVFALIEEHRVARAAWAPLSETWNSLLLTDPTYAAAEEAERGPGDRVRTALDALTAARPTTLPGVLALAEYLPDAIWRVSISNGGTEGERALRNIAAALRRLVPPAAPSLAPDPVLVAIQVSRQAQAEMESFIAETKAHPTLGLADREREGILSAAQIDADQVVWRTVPTTRAGRRALVDYARFQARVRTAPDGYVDDAEGLIEEILTAFSASIAAESEMPAQDPDEAQAHALVGEIERVWAEDTLRSRRDHTDMSDEAEARLDAALVRRDALIAAAERISAGTRAGRHAKALILAWLGYVDSWRAGWVREDYATDGRLAIDIEASLAAQGDAGGRA